MKQVNRNDLYVGMRVKDCDDDWGTILKCNDLHNVEITYDDGSFGLHCFFEGCEDNEEKIFPIYYDYRKEKIERILR